MSAPDPKDMKVLVLLVALRNITSQVWVVKLSNQGSTLVISDFTHDPKYRVTIPCNRVINVITTNSGLEVLLSKKNDPDRVSKTIIFCTDEQGKEIQCQIEKLKKV